MADSSPRDKREELLTERELEAIHKLARAIVEEAGLVRDLEKEAAEKRHRQFVEDGRQHLKAQIDYFKHMTVVSGASIVGVTALFGAFEPKLFAATFYFLSASAFLLTAITALHALFEASGRLVEFSLATVPPREESSRPLASEFHNARRYTYLSFSFGLASLLLTILITMPSPTT